MPGGEGAALRGRTAAVVGASRGIGLATARALAAAGARVAMVARGEEELRARAREVGASAHPGDAASAEGVRRLADSLVEALGDAPDLIVHCAGAFALGPVAEMDPADFDAMLDANLRSPFLVLRAFLPRMLERGRGHAVLLGSVAGRTAFPGNGAYSASKFGLRGLHAVLLEELRGSGVRVTLVEPAATDTPLWDPLDPDADPGLPPRAAMLSPESVARAIVFAVAQPEEVEIPHLAIRSART
jgi:NAD(P)-dependent dehydrogenase (short-subunit alcohol dehydrogenase family)